MGLLYVLICSHVEVDEMMLIYKCGVSQQASPNQVLAFTNQLMTFYGEYITLLIQDRSTYR